MQRWRGVEAAPAGWGRSVVTIGVFDGVHRGHQEIIGHLVSRARQLGTASVVVTFDPHPSEVVRPGSHPAVLTESDRKADLVEALGVDVFCVIPFTLEFSRLSAETFVHDVLVEHLHASAVVVVATTVMTIRIDAQWADAAAAGVSTGDACAGFVSTR